MYIYIRGKRFPGYSIVIRKKKIVIAYMLIHPLPRKKNQKWKILKKKSKAYSSTLYARGVFERENIRGRKKKMKKMEDIYIGSF